MSIEVINQVNKYGALKVREEAKAKRAKRLYFPTGYYIVPANITKDPKPKPKTPPGISAS